MVWSLYEKNGKEDRFLRPLKFSNNKTQEDIVNEVVDLIKKGEKVIFIRGVCGTGKSAIALNIAKEIGKSSIVVPIKPLQEQYKRDYESNKYLLKKDGTKLKISVMTGRKNHKCRFLEESKLLPFFKREVDLTLSDIFSGKENKKKTDDSADNNSLPCKVEIREKNWNKLREYLKQNNNINSRDYEELSDVTRSAVAGACPYWSPVLPESYELKGFSNKKSYLGLNGIKYSIYSGKTGCGFYEQFNAYTDADVIVFNSLKYKLETILNRKPATEVEIIDECDEFLDKFSNSRSIILDRLQNSLISVSWISEAMNKITDEIGEIVQQFKRSEKNRRALESSEIIPLKETGIYDLFKLLLKNPEIFLQIDEENYLFDVLETSRTFEDFLEDSFVTISKKEEQWIVHIVTTNLEKRFKEVLDKNKAFVLMSGTLHSEDVLREIFGIENYKIIEAEAEQQGQIKVKKTGLEMDCKYANFSNLKHSREEYLHALNKCIEISEKPCLIHVNSFTDLPTLKEKEFLKLNELVSREELMESQDKDKRGRDIEKFKKKQVEILFSTRCSRGVDFPGDECNSIVFTKYPNPNVQEAFWKILNRTKPQHYWKFYRDKAKRELLQKVYRGVRFKEDQVYVLSPDIRVINFFEKTNNL